MFKRALIGCALAGALLAPALTAPAQADPGSADGARDNLHVLVFDEPGTAGYHGRLRPSQYRAELIADQDALLARLGISEPVYRWTTAVSGVAVELDALTLLRARLTPGVRVERNTIRSVAGTSVPASSAPASRVTASTTPDEDEPGSTTPAPDAAPTGAGTVIGFVDTGITPELPVFADSPTLGEAPAGFSGTCEAADGWSTDSCNDKIIAATSFVAGFGADNLRAEAGVSPRDDHGHGTQVASIAAGDANVSALEDGVDHGTFSGIASDARIAVYKACWTAPDPANDGCSTADVISAIDQAVVDGVDVLNVSVEGTPGLDAVDRALLGATEAGVLVSTAAGNDLDATTGNEQPWVLTVGATTENDLGGELVLGDGTRIEGVLTSPTVPDQAPIVLASAIPAPGRSVDQARLCLPGSLDAAAAAGKVVVCERGTNARVSKSSAVDLADGVAMVLVNGPDEELGADFHAVPTLHTSAEQGQVLLDALAASDDVRGTLAHVDGDGSSRVLLDSARGDATGTALKPDLAAEGFGVLSASAPRSGHTWQLLSGTSAASARVSALAALVLSEHPDWTADRVRSALMTSAQPADDAPAVLQQGSGIASDDAIRPGLVLDLDPTGYREALDAATGDQAPDYSRLNLASVQVASPAADRIEIVRTLTNVGPTALYYSATASGFEHHRVTVAPAAIKIAPGESREVRIRIDAPADGAQADSGVITWLGADDTTVRIPVSLTD
ncbi:S8 family serine peptidase [Nocardioides sp. AE5]|uniref:S8 family serine peptidase n=1 Tax=Nocardioides sp. AE5 TaxID=2962573 RepID=UPI0028810C89|nr:S8 family serine peptidase [Nocardioides sp. AE5]MDT0203705.1 S8 family serine peptidase [Nocardioides sp. AE5]